MMNKNKQMRQSCIGNFFKKENVDTIWGTIDGGPNEKKHPSLSLKQRNNFKTSRRYKELSTKTSKASTSFTEQSFDDVFLKTPDSNKKCKTMISKRRGAEVSKEKLITSRLSSTSNKTGSNFKDSDFTVSEIKTVKSDGNYESCDKGNEMMDHSNGKNCKSLTKNEKILPGKKKDFTRSRSLASTSLEVKIDSRVDSFSGSKFEHASQEPLMLERDKHIPKYSLLNKNGDAKKPLDQRVEDTADSRTVEQRLFTRIQCSNDNKAKNVQSKMRQDISSVDDQKSQIASPLSSSTSMGIAGLHERTGRECPPETTNCGAELIGDLEVENVVPRKKSLKLKLKRLDKKRFSKFGSTGISPIKKKHVKDGDIEQKAKELFTKKSPRIIDSPLKNNESVLRSKNLENSHRERRRLFSEQNFGEEDFNLSEYLRASKLDQSTNGSEGNLTQTIVEISQSAPMVSLLDKQNKETSMDCAALNNKGHNSDSCGTPSDAVIADANSLTEESQQRERQTTGVDSEEMYSIGLEVDLSTKTYIENSKTVGKDSCSTSSTTLSSISVDSVAKESNCGENLMNINKIDNNIHSNGKNPSVSKVAASPTACSEKLDCKTATSTSDQLHLEDLNQSLLDISFGEDFDLEDAIPIDQVETVVKSLLVLEVQKQEYESGRNFKLPEKILRLFDAQESNEATCILREDWETMDIFHGDTVHITGFKANQGSCIVLDNNSPQFLTLFPNTLVSGTTISMGITCQRRAVLSEMFKTDGPSEAMILGTFLHDLFDHVIETRAFEVSKMERKAKELMQKSDYINILYNLDLSESEFLEKVKEIIPLLCTWIKKYLKDAPLPSDDPIDFKLGTDLGSDDVTKIAISKITDIEENILCPSLGLKGKVDASVKVAIHRKPKFQRRNAEKNTTNKILHIPLEIKTGKMLSKLGTIEHRAQVILYTLMMSMKYDGAVDAGLLYYMKTGHLQGVPASLREKRALIIKRNELVRYLSMDNIADTRYMPGMLKNSHTCKRCPLRNNCMVYHKIVEEGCADTSGIGGMFDEITDHLTKEEANYFLKWYQLIMLEAKTEARSSTQRKVWTKKSTDRELKGKCFSQMNLASVIKTDNEKFYLHTFERSKTKDYATSLREMAIMNGDRVIISEEKCKTFGLATGYVSNISEKAISVLCDQKIKPRGEIQSTLFRIEKDESLTSYKIPLANLMKLFSSRSEADSKLRQLIISLPPPEFSSINLQAQIHNNEKENVAVLRTDQGQTTLITKSQRNLIQSTLSVLNPDQRQAVEACLSAKDYVMILGMPGTGKTTTIACIVKAMKTLGKSVLITSYTHSAVDNILIKLKEMKLDFIRIGQTHKMLNEVVPYSLDAATKKIKSVQDLEKFYNSKSIFATTCLGVNHPLFLKKRFDYCIVDEASQITQPVCIGAIRCADAFILVGDHYQLPPLVQSADARNKGMDVSLFKHLSEHHPSAVVSLRYQYRMHESIMSLGNFLIYSHQMQCGMQSTGTDLLKIPKLSLVEDLLGKERSLRGQFMSDILKPTRPVVFIDTDSTPCLESQSANHISNQNEAELSAELVQWMLKGDVPCDSIGIISPYRHQLNIIKAALKRTCTQADLTDIEINTVDKYQGRDKPCIIVSFVRSNHNGNVGELLMDWRRINVAITRAKQKLIMIGSKRTLSLSPVLKKLIDYCAEKDWVENLVR